MFCICGWFMCESGSLDALQVRRCGLCTLQINYFSADLLSTY